jgi:Zn-dependent peptidase ImmA (M78 family)
VVLRAPCNTGRRFELARLLAEQIVVPPRGRLHAATRAYTYRQKMQRSFAAELLSPFDAVDAMLGGDYSAEAWADAAKHFQVSDLTIRTLLVNHHRLEREDLDEDLAAA